MSDAPEVYRCQWERPVKEGEEEKWWIAQGAQDMHEAAYQFARHCDVGNPRPPLSRVVRVALPRGGARLVEVVVRQSLSYETNGV